MSVVAEKTWWVIRRTCSQYEPWLKTEYLHLVDTVNFEWRPTFKDALRFGRRDEANSYVKNNFALAEISEKFIQPALRLIV